MTSITLLDNIELAPFTTLDVGGRARHLVVVRSEHELIEALQLALSRRLEVFVLGGGSNILVSDNGFEGLVIKIEILGIEVADSVDGYVLITAAAGENWDDFVQYCVGDDLAGVECLSGIPGLVGGTPIQNVGAYGQDVSETIHSVKCFDRKLNKFVEFTNSGCDFAYRKSRFNSEDKDRYVILSVTFQFQENGKPKIEYKELREMFNGEYPTLSEVRDAVIAIRRAKSMVIDPSDVNSRSAGSFFKNPIVDDEKYLEICRQFERVPNFPADDGQVKIPAAWLIEKAGFEKGTVRGKAGISSKHTLALINRGGATAAEIVALKAEIQAEVKIKFDIDLVTEPILLGFEQEDFDSHENLCGL